MRGTLVTMADGTRKPIEQLVVEDRVKSWDEVHGRFVDGSVMMIFHDAGDALDVRPIIVVQVSDGSVIRCTPHHKFLMANGSWLKAMQLYLGAPLASGRFVESASPEVSSDKAIWNIHVEPCPTYVVEGQIVHNKGGWARGGVKLATRKTSATFGEAGETELGIFIPKSMEQQGKQGREEEVVETMIRVLARLTGRKVEDMAIPMAKGGIVTKDNTLAMLHKDEMVIPLQRGTRGTDTATPGKPGSGGITVINVMRQEDLEAAQAQAVARGERVIINNIMQGLSGNRAIRRMIQRTS